MIQRIQTLYLAISIICLGVVSSGITIFGIEDKGFHGFVNSFGKTILTHENKISNTENMPFFIAPIILILLCLWTIMAYKKQKFQLKLGRLTSVVYLLALAGLIAYKFMSSSINAGVDTKVSFGLGFYIFIFGLPFVFLANAGIKKDKNLLDSLNRLR